MDAVTGEITWDAAEIEVYQDSIVLDDPERSSQDHFQQGNKNVKVRRRGRTAKTIAFEVMDVSADSKVRWLGGTKTTVATKDTWNEPEEPRSIKRAMRFTLEDGSVIVTPTLDCDGRLPANLNETDIVRMSIMGTVTATGVASVSAFQWTD